MIKTINPATGQLLNEYAYMEDSQVFSLLDDTHQAFLVWKKETFQARNHHILQLAKKLLEQQSYYAQCITHEMGKVYQESLAEIQKCAWVCEYYADHAEQFLSDEPVHTEAKESFIAYQPLGLIFSIMPWNFPFWQLFRFAVPAIMAGNAVILKHASNVSGCALAIETLFKEAGFPENLFRTLLIEHTQVEKVIQHPCVQAVTFTGGTQIGKQIAKVAGENLKKIVLELGGSDPYLILKEADLKKAVEACVASRFHNAGQSCIAAKRFIVIESIYADFVALFKQKIAQMTMGDPNDPRTKIGPLASIAQRDQLHKQVLASIERGAKCLLGGTMPSMQGAYYPPTLLVDVKKGMPAYDEELFGPVACVMSVKGTEEAIQTANDSCYGLGGAVFTENETEGRRIAKEEIESGSVMVNDFLRSDPRMPFGGIKESGYGRELSYLGIREFTNIKSVVIASNR